MDGTPRFITDLREDVATTFLLTGDVSELVVTAATAYAVSKDRARAVSRTSVGVSSGRDLFAAAFSMVYVAQRGAMGTWLLRKALSQAASDSRRVAMESSNLPRIAEALERVYTNTSIASKLELDCLDKSRGPHFTTVLVPTKLAALLKQRQTLPANEFFAHMTGDHAHADPEDVALLRSKFMRCAGGGLHAGGWAPFYLALLAVSRDALNASTRAELALYSVSNGVTHVALRSEWEQVEGRVSAPGPGSAPRPSHPHAPGMYRD